MVLRDASASKNCTFLSGWLPLRDTAHAPQPPTGHQMSQQGLAQSNRKCKFRAKFGGFSVMWVPKLLLSPVKTRIFCPKTTKFWPNLVFLVILGQALPAHLVPCWWLWRASCISQDTYLLYIPLHVSAINNFSDAHGLKNKQNVGPSFTQ